MRRMTLVSYFVQWFRTWYSKLGRKSPSSLSSSHPHPKKALHPLLGKLAQHYEGKLLLRDEITLSDTLFQSLLTQHYFLPTSAIHSNFIYSQCIRCHQRKRHLFGKLPCTRCGDTHLYCRNCIEMGRVLACESLYNWAGPPFNWPAHQNPCTWQGELTAGQEHAANRIVQTIQKQRAILIWAVTGAGKTEMLYPGITYALKQGMRICIASPRADVVRELVPRLQQAFVGISVQGLYGGSRDKDGTAQLILSTTHQLYRYKEAFDMLVIDEIDAFPFHQDETLQLTADRAKKERATTIYLTATPRRKQRMQMLYKKLDYVFVPTRFHGHPLIVPKWKYISSLKQKLQKDSLPIFVQEWLRGRNFYERQLLIFVPTIRLLNDMSPITRDFLLENGLLTSPDELTDVHAGDQARKEKVNDFRNRRLHVLLTTTILERGVTFPSIDVLVIQADHNVFDEAALVQIAGRTGRSPTDPFGEVMFVHAGKTNAMVQAKHTIEEMNWLSQKGDEI